MKGTLLSISIVLLLIAMPIRAEVTGILNPSNSSTTAIVTGLYAATYYQYCNSNSNCPGTDICITDWDGTSSAPYSGWCAPPSTTSCMNNDTWYPTSYSYCFGTLIKACSSGSWSGTTDCAATNKTCSAGGCAAGTTTTTGNQNTPGSNISSLSINVYPSDFNITQGESAKKTIKITNAGTVPLLNVRISLSGIPSSYYSFDITLYNVVIQQTSKNFTLTFFPPKNADVGLYTVTVSVGTTTSSSAKDNETFKVKILPSNATIANTSTYYMTYLSAFNELGRNITFLEAKGADVASLKNTLDDIGLKLSQANSSLVAKDYFTANSLLSEVRTLLSDLQTRTAATTVPPRNTTSGAAEGWQMPDIPWIYIVIAVVVIAVIGVMLYLFWPEKEGGGYHPKTGWKPPKEWKPSRKEEKKIDTTLDKLRKKKKAFS